MLINDLEVAREDLIRQSDQLNRGYGRKNQKTKKPKKNQKTKKK